MIPLFRDPADTRRWNNYFAEVDRLLARAGGEASEMRADLEAHLADSFAASDPTMSESARLEGAIERLGQPVDYLRSMIADELLDRGTRSYHPVPIVRGLYQSLGLGASRAIGAIGFGLGYIMLAMFVAMALLKPLWGDHVGLFRQMDGTVNFGIVANSAGACELLGYWIIPIALLIATLLYVVLTRTLRTVRKRRETFDPKPCITRMETTMRSVDKTIGEIVAFTALATLPVVGLGLAAASRGGLAALPMAAPLAMFAPALAAILVQRASGGRVFGADGLGLRLGQLRWWFVGIFGFATLCAASFAFTALIDPGAFAGADELGDAISRLGGIPDFSTPAARALAALALTILVAPFLNLPLYLGEELGWRGFLTPRLVALCGRPGVLLTGMIWGLWHLPLIMLGHNYGAQPLLGMIIWVPLCMALAVLLTALRNRGGAIWPAALAHGVLNQLATLLTGTLLVGARFTPLVDGAAGIAGLLVFGTAASVVYLRYGETLDTITVSKGTTSPSRLVAA